MHRLLLLAAALAALVACDDTFHYNKEGATGGDSGGEGYHPAGFMNPAVHGLEAKLHVQTCTDCHGADLTGSGAALSCDTCHAEGWRTDCTFCHGGAENSTGAPPEDIDDNDDPATVSFPPHTRHVETNTHTAFDCTSCHDKPTNVLTPGHLFDSTPAVAEVALDGGLSAAGSYSAGSCSNLYCHGDGRGDNGVVQVSDAPLACDSCHPGVTSGRSAWERMSGEHEDHLREGLRCDDCHGGTTADSTSILTPALHVNGTADFEAPAGLSRTGGTCTGTCHGELHEGEDWR